MSPETLVTVLIATAGLGWYWSRSMISARPLVAKRLTANTPDLPIQNAAISPDGKTIAYSDPLGIHLHSIANGDTRLLPETEGHVLIQWIPDGSGVHTQVP